MQLREMTSADWPQISRIYAEGIGTGQATFELTPPSWESWDASHHKSCRWVAELNGTILGWVALSPVSQRKVYSGVAESSIYISEKSRGQGIGRKLLLKLIEESEKEGFWMLQAGIFPENKASTELHLSCGFRIVGIRERVAKLHGTWRNNQLLERRSAVTGTD